MNNFQILIKLFHLSIGFVFVFHKDWQYTKEKIGADAFDDNETFIECNCSNWNYQDSLIEYYLKLKETYSDEYFQQLLHYFEEVFDTDWDYSKDYFGEINNNIIAQDGTFLYPKLTANELKKVNWENRDLLLEYYEEVR